jgi:hypothetical protein
VREYTWCHTVSVGQRLDEHLVPGGSAGGSQTPKGTDPRGVKHIHVGGGEVLQGRGWPALQ